MVKLCYFALKFVGNEIKCIWFSEMHQAVTSIELLNDIFIASDIVHFRGYKENQITTFPNSRNCY